MIKTIVKRELKNNLIFFLPESPARQGYICYWTPREGHGEASLQYFWSLKNPTEKQEEEIPSIIEQYANIGRYEPVKRVKRDSVSLRKIRYAHHARKETA